MNRRASTASLCVVDRACARPPELRADLSRWPSACLHLVDDEADSESLGDGPQLLEEVGRGRVVAALRLHGLDHYAGDGDAEGFNELLDARQTAILLGAVGRGVIRQRVAQLRKRGGRPVELTINGKNMRTRGMGSDTRTAE